MSDDDLQYKLAKHKVMKDRDLWLSRLSSACSMKIRDEHFLAVGDTLEKKKVYVSILSECTASVDRTFWRVAEKDLIAAKIRNIGRKYVNDWCVLFHSRDAFYGGVRLPMGCVLERPFSVWDVTELDLAVVSDNLVNGLCLEWGYFDRTDLYSREGLYELSIWGEWRQERL